MIGLSSFQLILVILGLGSLVFMLATYLSGIGLKEQFEKVGVRTLSIFEALKQVIAGKRELSSLSIKHFFEDLFYGLLNLFGIYPSGPFYDSIRQVNRVLEEKTGSKKILYKLPWFIMVGGEEAGKSSLLGNLMLSTPIPSPSFGKPDGHPLIQWWFYERGIVLDISGRVLNTEQPSRTESWEMLLKALKRYRPHRPLDGIILATSCAHFTGAGKLSTPELTDHATRMSDQLIKIEKMLGIKLPLYMILTKGDEIGGFQGFVRSLPPKFLEESFGWSNPYATSLAFDPKWIKEAFQTMYGSLFEATLRIFGNESTENPDRNDIVVFPESFSQLQDAIQTYLSVLFKVGDYDDHFIFRGLFLTGTGEKNAALKIVAQPFLSDLFTKKIFAEVGLAIPIKKFFLVMSKKINVLRLSISFAFLISIYGLYWTNQYLATKLDHIRPLVKQVQEDLETEDWGEYRKEKNDSYVFQHKGKNLLGLLDAVYAYRLRHPLLPISWFSPTVYKLDRVTIELYNNVIARNIAASLGTKAQLLTTSPLLIAPSQKGYQSPLETSEFLLLEGYVKGLADLERASLFYNTLQETQDLFQLAEILNYLYGYSLSPDFLKSRSAKKILITQASYEAFDISSYRLYAEKRLYLLYDAFLRKILDPEYIYSLAGRLQTSLHRVEGKDQIDLEVLKKSISNIKELVEFLTQAGGVWLSNPQFNPGSRYQQLIDQIKHIGLLGSNIPKTLFETSNKMYEKAIRYLRSYGSSITGYFFVISPQTQKLEPSPGLINLEKQLDTFLQQPFMQKTSGSIFSDKIPQGQFLHWDSQIVRNTLSLVETYRSFISIELSKYPANLKDTLRQAGFYQTQKNIESMLEQAQTFYENPARDWSEQAEDARRAQAMNISEVGPLFIKLLKDLDNIGGGATYLRLRNLLFEQMYRSLKKLDKALQEGSYYQPSDQTFSSWKGEPDAIFKAFNITDLAEMKDYFANQSARLLTMVINNAEPVINVLKSDLFDTDIEQVKLISKWHNLVEQAVAYKKAKTSGSMKALEKFMEEEGNKITYATCFTDLKPEIFDRPSSDYFTQKQNDLQRSIYKRCQELAAEKGAQQYHKLENTFNTYLANSFPFTRQVPNTPQLEAEVSWALLQEFFTELEALSPATRQSLKESKKYSNGWKKIEKFLSHMDAVKKFFETYFSPLKKEGDPGMTFDIKFRENRVKESFGNQIADWAFIFGDKSVSVRQNGPGASNGRWIINTPVSFGFQWNVSAMWPTENSNIPALVKVNNRSLFVYEGTWSILRAIMLHLTKVEEGGSPTNDVLLKFEIPLGPNPAGAPTTQAKLYIKLVPQTAKGQSAVNFKIPTFPVQAPKLMGEM
jgi:type VI secretion system protein ImpL